MNHNTPVPQGYISDRCDSASQPSHRAGQSLVSFMLIVPIMLMSIFWMLKLFEEMDYAQRVESVTWFGIRESAYGFMHQTLDTNGVEQEMASLFDQSLTQVEYKTSIAFKTDGSVESAVNEDLSQLLDALSVLNPLDISMVRNALVKVTYKDPFGTVPFAGAYDSQHSNRKDQSVSVTSDANMFVSWTSFAHKPDKTAYSKHGVNSKNAREKAQGKGFPSKSSLNQAAGNMKQKMKQKWDQVKRDVTDLYHSLSLDEIDQAGNYRYYKKEGQYYAYDAQKKQWYGEAPGTSGGRYPGFRTIYQRRGNDLFALHVYYDRGTGWLFMPYLHTSWNQYHENVWKSISGAPQSGPNKSLISQYADNYANDLLAKKKVKGLQKEEAPTSQIQKARQKMTALNQKYQQSKEQLENQIPTGEAGDDARKNLKKLNQDIDTYVKYKRAHDATAGLAK